MLQRRITTCAALCCALFSTGARADLADEEASLMTQRDALILKIFRGEDVPGSVSAYQKLLHRHEQLGRAAAQAQRDEKAREAELADYVKTSVDFEGGWLCRLSEPAEKGASRATDWGRVVSRVEVAVDSHGEVVLDGGTVTVYEVEGQHGRRFVIPKEEGKHRVKTGDLVILCSVDERKRADFMPPWNQKTLHIAKLFGVIAEPPRIVKKTQWNPIHITDEELRNAILYKRWETPAGRSVVALVRVEKELGNGRLAMVSRYWADPFVLDVPPGVSGKGLLKAGEYVWVIMNNPRFDKELGKLVLTAVDVELRYLLEPPKRPE